MTCCICLGIFSYILLGSCNVNQMEAAHIDGVGHVDGSASIILEETRPFKVTAGFPLHVTDCGAPPRQNKSCHTLKIQANINPVLEKGNILPSSSTAVFDVN